MLPRTLLSAARMLPLRSRRVPGPMLKLPVMMQMVRCYADKVVQVPPMAESISEGTLKQFSKGIGDYVEQDEEIATIETDKARSARPVSCQYANVPSLHRSMSPSMRRKLVLSRNFLLVRKTPLLSDKTSSSWSSAVLRPAAKKRQTREPRNPSRKRSPRRSRRPRSRQSPSLSRNRRLRHPSLQSRSLQSRSLLSPSLKPRPPPIPTPPLFWAAGRSVECVKRDRTMFVSW
jgi:hypothetical protein